MLCQTVEKIIKDVYPQTEIVPFDMSGKTGFSSFYSLGHYDLGTKLFLKITQMFPKMLSNSSFMRSYRADEHRYLRVWCALNDLLKTHSFDLAVFAGGSLFMDYFAGIIYMIVKRLSISGTRIIFHACGMSRLDADAEYLLKRALRENNIVSISLRDSYARFCELFSTSAEVIDTYDTALGCSKYFLPSSVRSTDYGIGLMAHEGFYEQQKNLIKQLLASGVSWKVFTNGARYDMFYAKKILSECGIEEKDMCNYLVARPKSSKELVCTVTQFEKIISFRMHSQIVAASFGIPCFAFAWDNKVVDLFEKLGLQQNYSCEEVDLEKIQQVISFDASRMKTTALTQAEISRQCLIKTISVALSCDQ